ncbi:phage portal protein [Rossellomorea vietnamensis]|uniref:phage portal protein n=1 Tax=Rossellomorea vietnamensis TaxID=218284 RepID=UPI003CF36CD5
MFDVEMIPDIVVRAHMKRLAIEICASFLGRTISQSEFRIKNGKTYEKDELYYRLNVRPNKNMTASTFWQTATRKLIYDNEFLIIQAEDDDLLLADDFEHNSYAVKEDTFSKVKIKGYEFRRVFKQSEVLHLRYTNEKLTPLIDGLFSDYGELFGRIMSAQKRKNQIRGTVDMDMLSAKTPEHLQKFQEFIDNMYKAIGEKDIAIVPQQKGTKYEEKYNGASNGPSVDEINKVTNGFLDQVAMALGIHTSLIRGDLADVEKHTKNYMMFTVNPLLKKIGDEGNSKFLTKEEYLGGRRLDIRQVYYQTVFDLANSIDKLISSGAFTGNELRDEAGWERSDDPNLDKHYITKNYEEMDSTEGGDNE